GDDLEGAGAQGVGGVAWFEEDAVGLDRAAGELEPGAAGGRDLEGDALPGSELGRVDGRVGAELDEAAAASRAREERELAARAERRSLLLVAGLVAEAVGEDPDLEQVREPSALVELAVANAGAGAH